MPNAIGRPILLIVATALVPTPAVAQSIQEIPNAMSAHTVFIIIIATAFLVWAASFSYQRTREDADRTRQYKLLVRRREQILDDFAHAEAAHRSGELDQRRYRNRTKKLRGDLARVVEKLQSVPRSKKKNA